MQIPDGPHSHAKAEELHWKENQIRKVYDVFRPPHICIVSECVFRSRISERGPWTSLLLFFIIIFLATWAGGVWLSPIDPPLWGAY